MIVTFLPYILTFRKKIYNASVTWSACDGNTNKKKYSKLII